VCDGTKLPYKIQTFDAVISFETIEHTKAFNEMLAEFKRVVKNDGVVIISTPNRIINSPAGIVTNPYHTQEWDHDELLHILKTHFASVQLYGQEYIRYKNKTQLNYRVGKWTEGFLYKRGIRKLPIVIQDAIMKLIVSQPMYPLAGNYELASDPDKIKKCKTFFAVCKLK
jgi:ubiquinone/menaquinone biosynthesis C-methylase UbiE